MRLDDVNRDNNHLSTDLLKSVADACELMCLSEDRDSIEKDYISSVQALFLEKDNITQHDRREVLSHLSFDIQPLDTAGKDQLVHIDQTDLSSDSVQAWSILTNVAKARISALTQEESKTLDSTKFGRLSKLQREILSWVSRGKSNCEIAIIMGRSERAVAYHISEILRKLEVTSRVQAATHYMATAWA